MKNLLNLFHQLPTTEMANPETLHSGNLAYWQAADGSSQTIVMYAGKINTWPNIFVIGEFIGDDYQNIIAPKASDLTAKIELA